ncbi:MAG: YgjV family protein [Anaerolineae bacterium]|nr:YgjV family protein [Anaerolineae bacterium]
METQTLYEIIGYVASIVVAISLTMRSVLRLRLVNLIGAAVFTIYGALIHAYPVAVLNALIVLIDLYYLIEMARARAYFALLEVTAESKYLPAFLRFHAQGIQQFFPHFDYTPDPADVILFVLRDMVPVGLFIAQAGEPGEMNVLLDYVAPGYRDLKPALFLYAQQAPRFRAQGITRLRAAGSTPAHRSYLERIGFTSQGDYYYRSLA